MQVIVVVLNKLDCLDDLLANLKRAGVRGGTIIESTGMIKTIDDSDESYLLGSLRLFLENPRPESRTIFFIVEDGQVDLVRKTVDESVVSDTVDPSVTEVTSENNEAAQAQDAAAAAAESAETPDTETVLPQDNTAAEAEETPEAGADQTVIVE